MKLLIYPYELGIGGTQINAIDLAAGAAGAGHDVVVYGLDGPLVEYIEAKGLRYVPAPPATRIGDSALKYPRASYRVAHLTAVARRERVDLIHSYEMLRCVEAYVGPHLMVGAPLLGTVLSMGLSPLIPGSMPIIMGTAELGAVARKRHDRVWVIEPPIDTEADHPGIDGEEFRRRHRVDEHQLLIVTVSRLAAMKIDALGRAIGAADSLAAHYPVRLVIVGGGEAHERLLRLAEVVNARWGREVVTLPGPDLDPRPAYAAADVVVGMGSSALRAMAIGKPVVVQGDKGFSEIFEPSSQDQFLWQGFHGEGDDEPGNTRLVDQLETLLDRPAMRSDLARWGRSVVVERFSLQRAIRLQLDIYQQVIERAKRPGAAEMAQLARQTFGREATRLGRRRSRLRAHARRLDAPLERQQIVSTEHRS